MLKGPVRFVGSAHKLSSCPRDGLPEVVLAGRSNAGKSSLVNSLAGSQKLARISRTPGKTRQLLYFRVRDDWYLTDLPGYGYTAQLAVRESFSELVDSYFTANRPIRLVLLLLDIRHEPSKDDLGLMTFLHHHGLPYALVLTKGDKLARQARRRRLEDFVRSYPEPEIFVISNTRREGIKELADWLEDQLAANP